MSTDTHIEELTQAHHAAGFALEHLMTANRTASPLESILLLDLIAQQQAVATRVRALLSALEGGQ